MIDLRTLPPLSGRWCPAHKERVVIALRRGEMTEAQACERFDLSTEEFASWSRRFATHGRRGLAVTRLQQVRA